MINDIRYALRSLLKNPGFTAVALLALTLGIGANTAIFSVLNAVVLSALPYGDPSRLVMVFGDNPKLDIGVKELPLSPGDFTDIRESASIFRHFGVFQPQRVNLSGSFDAMRLEGASVTDGFFEAVGVAPLLGRTFTSEEQQPGNNRVVVLSHGIWLQQFGGDGAVIGRKVLVDGVEHAIVGVMPESFQFPLGAELPSQYGFGPKCQIWLPEAFSPKFARSRGNRSFVGVARLNADVSVAQADVFLRSLGERVKKENPAFGSWGYQVISLRDQVSGRVGTMITLMSVAVGFVLLIACSNVANLLLARASSRSREVAVRTALGAVRSRIVRQFLTESIMLSLVAAAFGTVLAVWGTELLVKLSPGDIPRLDDVGLDWHVLLFTVLLSMLTGILFGLAPAIAASRTNVSDALKDGSRGSGGTDKVRARNVLTAAEVALAMMLLVSAGLLIRSFAHLYNTSPGFDARSVLAMDFTLPDAKYDTREKMIAFWDNLLARISSLPSVVSVGGINNVPLSGQESLDTFRPEGMTFAPGQEPFAEDRGVTTNYFHTAGIPILHGRDFSREDTPDAKRVVIVNRTLATRYFGSSNAVGKRFKMGPQTRPGPFLEIIGVTADVKQAALNAEMRPQIYHPVSQNPRGTFSILVRTSGDPMNIAGSIREQLRGLDPNQPMTNVRTLEQVVSDSVSRQRFTAVLLTIFAATATLLAIIGLYGVMSYQVTQRTREIGVRMALGAARGDILWRVVAQGLGAVTAGAVVGLIGSLAAGRLLAGFLFGVRPNDPITLAGVFVLIFAVATAAALIPARRATKVDPTVALRYE